MGITKTEHYPSTLLQRADVFKALGHPARLAIVEHLLAQDRCGLPILEETLSSMSPVEEAIPQPMSQAPVVGRCKPGSGCC